jgi:GTP-binding protein Era
MKKQINLFNLREQILQVIESFGEAENPVTSIGKKKAALDLVDKVGRLNAAIALQPLPIADILFMTPIQVGMVIKIAKIYGIKTNNSIIREIVFTVVKGVLARSFTRSLLKFVPFLGIPVSIFVSYLITKTMGLTAIKVFESEAFDSPFDLKERFKKEYEYTSAYVESAIYSMKDTKKTENHPEILDKILYIPCEN